MLEAAQVEVSGSVDTFSTDNMNQDTSDVVYEESIDSFSSNEVKTESKAEAKTAKKEPKAEKAETKNKENNEIQDQEDGEANPDGEPKGKTEGKTDGDAKTEEKTRQERNIKAKSGEEEIKLNVETEIPVKINGEVRMVKLSELRDNFSGAQAWDKKFQELSSEKKEVEEQINTLAQSVKGAREALNAFLHEQKDGKTLDHEENLLKVLDFFKVDSDNILSKIRDAHFSEFEKLMEMNDAERRAYFAEKENARLKSRESLRVKTQSEQTKILELRKQVDTAREAAGVSEEAFAKAYDTLAKSRGEGSKVEWQEAIQFAKVEPFIDKAETILNSVKSGLGKDTKLLEQVTTYIMTYPNSENEVVELIKGKLGISLDDAKILNKKAGPQTTRETKASEPVKSGGYESFDDFDI